MTDHTVSVDNGKYTFVSRLGFHVDVLRHGEPWVTEIDAPKAVMSLMAELDAARVVLAAARALADAFSKMPVAAIAEIAKCDSGAGVGLVRALALHSRLVDDRTLPSAWCVP